MDKIINDFKNSKFFNRILTHYNDIIAIFVSGSRVINYNDPFSDYDIIILREHGDIDEVPFKSLYYKNNLNIALHWTYFPIKYMHQTNKFFILGGIPKNCFVKEENLIYKNPKYHELIDLYFNNYEFKKHLFKVGLVKFYKNIQDNILFIKENKGIPVIPYGNRFYKSKDIYSLFFAANLYYSLGISKEFIMRIKKANEIEISKNDNNEVFKLLDIIDNLISKEDIDDDIKYLNEEIDKKIKD